MDATGFDSMLDMWPLPAMVAESRQGIIVAANELASRRGFCRGERLTDMMSDRNVFFSWLSGGDKPAEYRTELCIDKKPYRAALSVRTVAVGGQDALLIVLTSLIEPGAIEENTTVAALCDIYAGNQKNALQAYLRATALTLGAFCAAVYEMRRDRYIIREEWRGRRTVCISILSADFEIHPDQEMARVGQLKRAEGVGYASYIKKFGTRGVLIYFFEDPADQSLQPRIERFARLLRVLSPDIQKNGTVAVIRRGLDSLQQGIAIWDRSAKKLLYENKAYQELFGSKIPFNEGRKGIEPALYSDGGGRHYSLTHTASNMGGQRFVTTFVADVTRYKRTEQKLAMTAKTDPLTGLYNRRAGIEILQEAYEQSRRSGRALTVGFADIDGLKQINDTYGHGAGDAMICAAAEVLKKHAGKNGTVCRLGGDEFVMILPGVNNVQATLMARQIKSAVARCVVGESRGISISFGFKQAEYSKDETAESLISFADTDMYRDKRGGSAE